MLNIWGGLHTRGPPGEAPSTSGRSSCETQRGWYRPHFGQSAGAERQARRPHSRRSGRSVIATASSGGSSEPPSKPSVSISDEEGSNQDVPLPAPVGGPKTLKINIDLLLWRCRQARLAAQLSLSSEQRRELQREAEAGLRRCLALDPGDGRTYVVLGKLLLQQRRLEEARTLYSHGVNMTGSSNPYIWASWGWLELRAGQPERARKLLDAATVVDGTHACAWHKWGQLERAQGNFQRARDLWMQGIQRCRNKRQPQNAYLYNALAVMAAKLGRVAEARAWFEEGTSSLEGAASVALWQAWAVMEALQGDPSACRYLFKKALAANPKSRYVHLAWGLFERQLGNLPQCVELLRRGLALNPSDAALYQALALVQWRDLRSATAARNLFESGLKADPAHLPLWQAWGCMEASQGEVARARHLFQQGVWADSGSPDTVFVFHAWGCLERSQGDVALARELFKAAIKVDPKSEVVWDTWIITEEELGFAERADELRIRRQEQQWEFQVPAGFTTRPDSRPPPPPTAASSAPASGPSVQEGAGEAVEGRVVGGAKPGAEGDWGGGSGLGVVVVPPPPSPLAVLQDVLARFFNARRQRLADRAAAQQPPGLAARPVRDFLPDDFSADLRMEDVLPGGLQLGARPLPPPPHTLRPQAPPAAALIIPGGAEVEPARARPPGLAAPPPPPPGTGGGRLVLPSLQPEARQQLPPQAFADPPRGSASPLPPGLVGLPPLSAPQGAGQAAPPGQQGPGQGSSARGQVVWGGRGPGSRGAWGELRGRKPGARRARSPSPTAQQEQEEEGVGPDAAALALNTLLRPQPGGALPAGPTPSELPPRLPPPPPLAGSRGPPGGQGWALPPNPPPPAPPPPPPARPPGGLAADLGALAPEVRLPALDPHPAVALLEAGGEEAWGQLGEGRRGSQAPQDTRRAAPAAAAGGVAAAAGREAAAAAGSGKAAGTQGGSTDAGRPPAEGLHTPPLSAAAGKDMPPTHPPLPPPTSPPLPPPTSPPLPPPTSPPLPPPTSPPLPPPTSPPLPPPAASTPSAAESASSTEPDPTLGSILPPLPPSLPSPLTLPPSLPQPLPPPTNPSLTPPLPPPLTPPLPPPPPPPLPFSTTPTPPRPPDPAQPPPASLSQLEEGGGQGDG